ncbi:MAG TPA: glycerol-3-phosphate dehydrogenase [Xanthobacteraceae bacterium]|jgi:glycerol-3-phosphate dehydrogenase|nr:glycerol-3-phosphate dehydrogenase [Xanthobacteraceae bacterium]
MGIMADFDLAIVGGGINGAGIARDAAGRGISVLLVEQNDLASATSFASTKLIHGGLRYLEHWAFRLVHEALAEREVLLQLAPHLIRPMRFVLPHHEGLRPAWQLRAGLFLYDHLGGRRILPGTQTLDLTHGPLGVPLKRRYKLGFEYSDCQVDDTRLVIANACDAAERGAVIRTRTRLVRADRDEQAWQLVLSARGHREVVTARVLVNASGPWVGQVTQSMLRLRTGMKVRLVKGSHIVVRRLFDHDRAYIFQGADGRIVFAIPYHRDFTLIGTTDENFDGDPASVVASPGEIEYLCQAVSVYLRTSVEPGDVVQTFAGVRPLYDDGAGDAKDVTRDYVLALNTPFQGAPLLTVYGGKITTYRRLAEAALAKIANYFGPSSPWTHNVPLPGGDFAWDGVDGLVDRAQQKWPFLTRGHISRLIAVYGTRIDRVLENVAGVDDLAPWFGADLSASEVRYLMRHEWAQTTEDVLWRRTKLGLYVSPDEEAALGQYMTSAAARVAAE